MKSQQESHALRAAPSAGALYPAEIYVATRGIEGIADGVHDYQVRDHSLVTLWDGDFWSEFQRYSYGHEAIERSNLLVIFSAVFYRSSWRYEERAYRRILLDTGPRARQPRVLRARTSTCSSIRSAASATRR